MSNNVSSTKNSTGAPINVSKLNSKITGSTNVSPDSNFQQLNDSDQEKQKQEKSLLPQRKVESHNALDLQGLEFIGQLNKIAINNKKKNSGQS
ncbi:MAG: hypothetical protein P4N41_03375 [Negativicutes bacterium]|nr:hypothetical protein [Negativicutes bacterium]